MSADRTGVPPSDDSVARLNEQQAVQLLNIRRMLARQRWAKMPFGWERLATASCCHRALEITGLFGENVSDAHFIEIFRLPYRDMLEAGNHFWFAEGRERHEASFAQSAAFLDIVSEWVRCDEIYTFLSSSTASDTSLVQRLYFGPRHRVKTYERGSLVATRMSTDPFIRGLYKYAELAESLFDLVSDEKFPFAAPWFWWCMSYWFQPKYSDQANLYLGTSPEFDLDDRIEWINRPR